MARTPVPRTDRTHGLGWFSRFAAGERVLDLARAPDAERLPLADGSEDAVLGRFVLEQLADPQAAIAEWFRVLRVCGHLLISAARERTAQTPGGKLARQPRCYTAAALLGEVEDALDPMLYRVRHLEETDGPTGEIVVALQRIAPPAPARTMSSARARLPDPGEREPVLAIETHPPAVERILVLKLDHRGDFIMARAGFEALRARYPSAHITLACGPWNEDAARRLALFDRVVCCAAFPEGGGGTGRTPAKARRRLAALLAGRAYDLAIDMRLHEDTRELLQAVDARVRAGFGSDELFPFLDIALPLPDPTADGRAEQLVCDASRFHALLGQRQGEAIVTATAEQRKAEEIIIYGPYEDLSPGKWGLELLIESTGTEFQLGFDIAADDGREILAAGLLQVLPAAPPGAAPLGAAPLGATPLGADDEPSGGPRVVLDLAQPARALEIRLRVGPSGSTLPFRFAGCRLTRRRSFSALHQQEMQFLLCCLVGLRMRHPHCTRELA